MKQLYFTLLALLLTARAVFSQDFDIQLNLPEDLLFPQVTMPKSPLTLTPIFIGGVSTVQTPDGPTVAKEWHDFIGITPDDANPGEFWVSVNHEMLIKNDKLGDGGGMTVFKIRQFDDGSVQVLNQTINGMTGQYFNVDFKNTVGETLANCGGIMSPDGRIWTSEEWFQTSNKHISSGISDTADFTIGRLTPSGITGFDGLTIKKYQNFNWMVEIDPKNAVAIRKQYNWGRQPFEGGAISKDLTTVYMGSDYLSAFFTKFVATTPGDFTSGKLYAYKHAAGTDAETRWVEIDNSDPNKMLYYMKEAVTADATMFCRLEWMVRDPETGDIYMTETGIDDLGKRWPASGTIAEHHYARATALGVTGPRDAAYTDYYGRVLKYDVSTGEISVYLEGGPEYSKSTGQHFSKYPSRHLSNPDGLTIMQINGKKTMLIQEDLNGTSYNRMPYGFSSRRCELFALDMSISSPTVNDLQRITTSPNGAEITGAVALPNGKTILVNSQHPVNNLDVNDYPYNHSLTVAITGIDQVITSSSPASNAKTGSFQIYPNPASREVNLSKVTDIAIYDTTGKRLKVFRETDVIDVSDLSPGLYILNTKDHESISLVIQ